MTEPTREEIIKALRHIAEISTSKNIICTNAANLIESDSARIAQLEAENKRMKVVLTDKLSAWRAEGDSDEHETYEIGYKNGYKYGQINLIREVLGVAEPPEESEG